MARGEIIINDNNCRGCGYCQGFCKRGCIVMSEDKFTPLGYILPILADSDRCNACGVCGQMCPHFAIEVYKFIES
ncbi:MAG: 4Fe-4S binding protein [Desulfobacterales bacterium]|nr:4Fe-4S binding protein [Desulfobacterales bacterium]